MKGKWHGTFKKLNEHLTRLEFVEEITMKNKAMEIASYLFFPIKKMQKLYMQDLKKELEKRE